MLLDFSYTDLMRVDFFLLVVNSGCAEGDVRLVGGKTAMEGRVEVCHNQTWWAVRGSSWYWNYRDPTVVCRHLHYPCYTVPGWIQSLYSRCIQALVRSPLQSKHHQPKLLLQTQDKLVQACTKDSLYMKLQWFQLLFASHYVVNIYLMTSCQLTVIAVTIYHSIYT